jgi:hypothetical protein
MTMVAGLLLALVMMLRFGPDTPVLSLLRAVLVERPSAWLSTRSRHSVLVGVMVLVLLFGGGEMMVLLGPEFLLVTATNIAFYVDALAISTLLAASAAVRGFGRRIKGMFSRQPPARKHSRKANARRARRQRPASVRPPANDTSDDRAAA